MTAPEIAQWMGEVDPSQLGFPLAVERSSYVKTAGIEYKQTADGPLLLDAYRPQGNGRHPVIIMIHGGSWMQGGRYEMGLTKWAGYLASGGMAVVSIDYRLAPQTTYPDSFQDCLDAVDFVVDHADELGVDCDRIALWGDSAGGHLALLLTCSQSHPSFTGAQMRAPSNTLRGCVAFYPPTDLLRLHQAEQRGGGSTVRAFVGVDPEADSGRWREASPIELVHDRLPPIFILQGTSDFLVPHSQAVRFAEKLAEVGGEHRLEIVEGGVHGFDRVAPGERAIALIEETRHFLRQRLGLG